ncbi:Lecithin:cholesterol/phospholipid:diacylglycerol acyltransferase-like protein [Paramicrosporidium saccamoebae]|uniref:Lecithin:cholesterol/phospholipid:diacylglycerol acyltransferase-like protein n=1 Tax=Paramicrosporidium saccamoebae TaxID=1246581 RepID=A0A2H9TLX5_9FUNG|nr:Lecithin:cholesterol/phospholipid:diacylglycerol acyltransferase-like protein [Paramicrosporidium saccamoebae]
MMRFMVMDSACWLQHLKLNSTTGTDPDNIKLRPAQGLEAADFILPGFWVWAPIIENLSEIGYDHNNLIMAPYDWRLDMARLEERDHYFTRLKMQIELLVKTTGEKAAIVSHSLGGVVWFYFMKWVESSVDSDLIKGGGGGSSWVAKHIHASVSIGAPYLGVPKSLSMIISGEMRDTAQLGQLESFLLEMLMSKKERLSLFRSWVGGSAMLPKGGDLFWGNGKKESLVDGSPDLDYGLVNMGEEIALEAGMKAKYLTSDVDAILQAFLPPGIYERIKRAYADGEMAAPAEVADNDNDPRTWTNPLRARLPYAPEMTMYSIYGIGRDTERAYEYETVPREQWPESWQLLADEDLLYHQRTDNTPDMLVRIKLRLEAAEKTKNLYTGIYHVDGDGTVPTLSNGYMSAYGWKNLTYLNPSKMKTVTREYKDEPLSGIGTIRGGPKTSEHVDILGNHEVTMDFLKIVSTWDEEGSCRGWSRGVAELMDTVEQVTRKLRRLAVQNPRASIDALLRFVLWDNSAKDVPVPEAAACPEPVESKKHILIPSHDRMNSVLKMRDTFIPPKPPSILSSVLGWFQNTPARSLGRRICIIGVHGWFPTRVLQTVVGVPKGTSVRLCLMMEEVTKEFVSKQPLSFFETLPRIDCLPLEGEGCILERVEHHFAQLDDLITTEDGQETSGRSLVENADSVLFVAHSQGAPVTALLAERMIDAGILKPEKQCVAALTLAGVFHGPFPSLRENLVVRYVEADAARELFELNEPTSELSMKVHAALNKVLSRDVLFCCIASWMDQVVPLHSATLLGFSHPNIWRAVYIDAHNYQPDFLSQLVLSALTMANASVPGARELVAQLGEALAGSLYQSNAHSTLYEDYGVYSAVLRWMYAIPRSQSAMPTLHHAEMVPRLVENPYFLPWTLRGLLNEEGLSKSPMLLQDLTKLKELHEEWRPDRKVWKELKLQAEPLSKI